MIGCRTKNKLLKNWQENKIWQPLASDREISLQSKYNILNSRSIDKKEICKLRMFHIYVCVCVYICDDDSTKEKRRSRAQHLKLSWCFDTNCILFKSYFAFIWNSFSSMVMPLINIQFANIQLQKCKLFPENGKHDKIFRKINTF
jgi:hypothetical protein